MEDKRLKKEKRLWGLRASAVLEMGLFFLVMLTLNLVGIDGHRFWDVEPHPYWIIVLLMSVRYGTAEGVIAAIVASAVLLLGGDVPQQQLDEDMYAYMFQLSLRPVLWLLTAVVLGEIRQRQLKEQEDLREALAHAQEREEKIAESYAWVREQKQALELRIAGQFRSVLDVYKAAKSIEKLDPKDVTAGIEDLVVAVLHPTKFSLFRVNNEGLHASLMHGWASEDSFARHFETTHPLYQQMTAHSSIACAANEEHARVLAGEGVLAGALVDDSTGKMIGMLKIEAMAFTQLSLSTLEAFRSVCEWVAMALLHAEKYQLAKTGSVINPDHQLLTSSYFKRHTDYIASLSKRLNFNVAMVVVRMVDASALDAATRNQAAQKLSQAADKILRSVDLAFDYQEADGEFSIVLPATDRKGAQVVQEKLERLLAQRGSEPASPVVYSFSVQMIHEK